MAGIQRWTPEMRPSLFSCLIYPNELKSLENIGCRWGKLSDPDVTEALDSLIQRSRGRALSRSLKHDGVPLFYRTNALYMLSVFTSEPPAFDKNGNRDRQTKGAWLNFNSEVERDLAFLALAGRWGYLWWLFVGNDMDVNRWTLESFPADLSVLNSQALLALADDLRQEAPRHIFWVKKAGRRLANYDLRRCCHITDEADWLLAQAWGLTREQYEAAGNLRDRMTFGNRD